MNVHVCFLDSSVNRVIFCRNNDLFPFKSLFSSTKKYSFKQQVMSYSSYFSVNYNIVFIVVLVQ